MPRDATPLDPDSAPIARPESPIAPDGLQRVLDLKERRALVAENHLRREVLSNQALVAQVRNLAEFTRRAALTFSEQVEVLRASKATAEARIAELEALCAYLGVAPHFTPNTEPTFLPLADIKDKACGPLCTTVPREFQVGAVAGKEAWLYSPEALDLVTPVGGAQ